EPVLPEAELCDCRG
nr:immunoglobulin heavy chain junction region [Homo sapiens]